MFEVYFCCFQLSVRGKNKKEKIGGFFKTITKSADEVLLSNHKVSSQMCYKNIAITKTCLCIKQRFFELKN